MSWEQEWLCKDKKQPDCEKMQTEERSLKDQRNKHLSTSHIKKPWGVKNTAWTAGLTPAPCAHHWYLCSRDRCWLQRLRKLRELQVVHLLLR